MRILITGGFGYLGGRLAQFLISKNNDEIIIGTRRFQKPPHWLPRATVVETKWDSRSDLEKICENVDVIFHLAGMNAQDCANDPTAALEFNGVSTANLLNAAKLKGVRKFIYLSTAHVYGAPLTGEITEKTCPVNLHPYAASHRAAEDIVRYAHHRDEIEGVVVRLSNAFGATANIQANCWMLLINDLCAQAISNKSMILKSSGLQRRDFISLGDVVRALAHLLGLNKEQVRDGVFNVGGQWAPRIIDVVEIVQERCHNLFGFSPEIVRPDPDQGEVSLPLDYRIDKLNATGFLQSNDNIEEIDATLLLCSNSGHKAR